MAHMRRTWPHWDVTEEVLEQAAEKFTAALYRDDIPESYKSGRAVVALERVIGAAAVTEILSGTSDRKSRAWQSAQRTQQRYRKGERGKTLKPETEKKMKAAARRAARARFLEAGEPLAVSINVTWTISRDTKPANPKAKLFGEWLAGFKDAVLAGRWVRAVQIVTDVYGAGQLSVDEVIALDAVHTVRIG